MCCLQKHKDALFSIILCVRGLQVPEEVGQEHAAGAEFALATLHQYQPFEQYIILDVRLAGGRSKYVD